jgi:hypothetical protein
MGHTAIMDSPERVTVQIRRNFPRKKSDRLLARDLRSKASQCSRGQRSD